MTLTREQEALVPAAPCWVACVPGAELSLLPTPPPPPSRQVLHTSGQWPTSGKGLWHHRGLFHPGLTRQGSTLPPGGSSHGSPGLPCGNAVDPSGVATPTRCAGDPFCASRISDPPAPSPSPHMGSCPFAHKQTENVSAF